MAHDLVLDGCTASVLASYLKALAVHRLVAEQLDADARSWWDDDGRFHLDAAVTWESLMGFFVHDYRPTPIVTPWNGGSGFHPGDQSAGIDAIRESTDARFEAYRRAIDAASRLLASPLVQRAPEAERKRVLLELARSWLPEEVVPWLDAAYVVAEQPAFSALLGTGGNDGRLEFANNFMQRLAEMFLTPRKGRRREATVADRIDAALFARAKAGVHTNVSFGQFAPAHAGGVNMGAGLSGDSRVNPWDFVLAIEGSLCFAGATVRRLESHSDRAAAFPFHVAMSGVGYGSASRSDDDRVNARSELWLPLWSQPCGYAELAMLFGEGRLQVGRRRAHDGLDAVRAVASLGFDRGVDRFQRIGILKRNGLSFLATSQGTIAARRVPDIELLEGLHDHIAAVSYNDPAPAAATALRGLRDAMFSACQQEHRGVEVLASVGRLERALARSPKSRPYRPLPMLDADWYRFADDGSAEFALAASFASWPDLRASLTPIEGGRWNDTARVPWPGGDPLRGVVALAARRLLRTDVDGAPRARSYLAHAHHLAMLLDGRLDRSRFEDLLFALVAVRSPQRTEAAVSPDAALSRDAVFWTLRAVTSPTFARALEGVAQRGLARDAASILALVGAGRVDGAIALATRRLRALGRPPLAPTRSVAKRDTDCLAAALVVPLPPTFEGRALDTLLHAPSATERNDSP